MSKKSVSKPSQQPVTAKKKVPEGLKVNAKPVVLTDEPILPASDKVLAQPARVKSGEVNTTLIQNTRDIRSGTSTIVSKVSVFLISLVFGFLLFGNISRPLLWADESMTTMFASRVLDYGYPKVHDDRGNVVYDAEATDPSIGIDEKRDAVLVNIYWLQYYFTAPFVWLSRHWNDIYTQTLILRLPFAIVGLLGLLLVFSSITSLFNNKSRLWSYGVLYGVLCLSSITLLLHLREVRYYSLNILFLGLFLYLFTQARVLKKLAIVVYVPAMSLLFIGIFLIYFPFYFTAVATLGVAEGLLWLVSGGFSLRKVNSETRSFIFGILPIVLALPVIIPLISYFRVFEINDHISSKMQFTPDIYRTNLAGVFRHLGRYEFLYLALFAKLFMLAFTPRLVTRREAGYAGAWVTSILLFVFTLTYLFVIARVPFYVFIRYFVLVIPAINVSVVLDSFLILRSIEESVDNQFLKKVSYNLICSILLISSLATNYPYLKNKFYEATHSYQGPLDVAIPYIKERFKNTHDLTIATNYEDSSLLFYLDCKIAVGFVGLNKVKDAALTPDIIFYRKRWGNHADIFNAYLNKDQYEQVKFPVVDFPVNNIAELDFPFASHQFKTLTTEDEREQVYLFVKK